MLALVLIVAAAACLAAALLSGSVLFSWIAFVVSVAGIAFLAVWLIKKRTRSSSVGATSPEDDPGPTSPESETGAVERPTPAESVDEVVPVPDADGLEPEIGRSDTGQVSATTPEESMVRVIPGRRRFHAQGCRLLAGHQAEEIFLEEARDEGFTPCTVCVPPRDSLLPALS
ncbi:MAG: hypothetical protein QOG76_3438 [Pseudonocardiales bacterium]|nr:hypothetical protein [Pseudonocardiales bacterium]